MKGSLTEEPPRHYIVFWSGTKSNGPKMPIIGPKCQFCAKFGRFWAINPIFWGKGVKLLVPSYRESNETPFSCWNHWSVRLQLAARGENVLFWPKNLDIWGQKSIFCMVIAIFVNRAYHQYTRGYNFPIRTTPKENLFRADPNGKVVAPGIKVICPVDKNHYSKKKWLLAQISKFLGQNCTISSLAANLIQCPTKKQCKQVA